MTNNITPQGEDINPEIKIQTYPEIIDMRLQQLHYAMEEQKVDAAYISYLPNIKYLTNFSGIQAELIVHQGIIHFFTDARYQKQVEEELYDIPGLKIHITNDIWEYCKDTVFNDFVTLGFEADKIPYSIAIDIRNQIRPVKFKPTPFIFEPFTQAKGKQELKDIQTASEIAEQTYEEILGFIRLKMTEKEIANEIGYISRKLGSEQNPTPIIVTSGERGAFINGMPTDKKIRKNELLMINFSTQYNGFCSEISRTIAINKTTVKQNKMYNALIEAQMLAAKIVVPGMTGEHLDLIVRDYLSKKGFGEFFKHALGYGVGVSTKEHPMLSPTKGSNRIPDKAVLTIAPGVYTKKFGLRVQDLLQVTPTGGQFLTKPREELMILKF